MLTYIAHTIMYAAGAIAIASIAHTIRTTAPAVRKLLRQAAER
jgi:hypothetical protein